MKDLPIGFIDSGFGGLTVVKQSLKQLPNESIIFLGDSARAPYGPKPLEEVQKYITQMSDFLIKKGIKMLVIACNTGTAAALDVLRNHLEVPVVGVIHAGSRSAIKQSQNGCIGVIATQGTIDSGLYERVLKAKSSHVELYSKAVPEFVTIVEEGRIKEEATLQIVHNSLNEFVDKDVDTLVLGCTHYPHLSSIIQEVLTNSVTLIDSGAETINEVSALLDYFKLSRSSKDVNRLQPTQTYYTTGNPEKFADYAREWLHQENIQILQAEIKGDEIIETINSES